MMRHQTQHEGNDDNDTFRDLVGYPISCNANLYVEKRKYYARRVSGNGEHSLMAFGSGSAELFGQVGAQNLFQLEGRIRGR